MGLAEELERVAERAAGHAEGGEQVAGVLAAEASGGVVYLCAFAEGERRRWLAVDEEGEPLADRRRVRDAVSIAALCEVAVEAAGGGSLDELRAELLALRLREAPPGIEEAEEAALELERVLGAEPRLASLRYLDAVGAAARRLEQALGDAGGSPFAALMRDAFAAVEALTAEVEANYKLALR